MLSIQKHVGSGRIGPVAHFRETSPVSLSIERPALYVVATPIGNLADLSHRAQALLASADLLLVEDTRVTQKLLLHYAITNQLVSLHEHNETRNAKPAQTCAKPAPSLHQTRALTLANASDTFEKQAPRVLFKLLNQECVAQAGVPRSPT